MVAREHIPGGACSSENLVVVCVNDWRLLNSPLTLKRIFFLLACFHFPYGSIKQRVFLIWSRFSTYPHVALPTCSVCDWTDCVELLLWQKLSSVLPLPLTVSTRCFEVVLLNIQMQEKWLSQVGRLDHNWPSHRPWGQHLPARCVSEAIYFRKCKYRWEIKNSRPPTAIKEVRIIVANYLLMLYKSGICCT